MSDGLPCAIDTPSSPSSQPICLSIWSSPSYRDQKSFPPKCSFSLDKPRRASCPHRWLFSKSPNHFRPRPRAANLAASPATFLCAESPSCAAFGRSCPPPWEFSEWTKAPRKGAHCPAPPTFDCWAWPLPWPPWKPSCSRTDQKTRANPSP